MTLIEQLSKGEVYVKNDCTPEEMLSILELAFPQSDSLSIKSINNFVLYKPKKIAVGTEHGGTNDWVQYYSREPEYSKAISAKEFLNEINKIE